ncbi:hypothetical protein JFL43_20570 [Viridibacillus sp. YIM B01967]|uniref:Uncharacterized protein n=1 Tax=Viridibacillus soli TaxID=2798301 RepID=A0ABS1HDX6_9BACL|nr:hypothetical protein [Viridibacillus soli]MBK3497178.1 hypothetical protein [Viridibacillus soli]
MVTINNFNTAMQQFLNQRVDSVLYEIGLQFEVSDLSQSIGKLLIQSNAVLEDEKVKDEIVEKMQDLVFTYQHDFLKQVYLTAFLDGLKLNQQ